MTFPALEQVRRMDLSVEPGDEADRSTFCEVEQKLRSHMDDLRVVLREFRSYGLRPTLREQDLLIGDARMAWLVAYFAACERGQRVGRERGDRMIEEARQFAGNYLANAAPWFGDDDD